MARHAAHRARRELLVAAVTFPRAAAADIALLLEGTFPYVSGGVSSWVNQIIRAFPEYRFALVFIGSRRSDYGDMKYALPDNVVHLETHYLHEQWGGAAEGIRGRAATPTPSPGPSAARCVRRRLPPPPTWRCSAKSGAICCPAAELTLQGFLHSERAWRAITEHYRSSAPTRPSSIISGPCASCTQPIWMLARIADELIPVRAYPHRVHRLRRLPRRAAGQARRGRPLILSEHGIYTKERKIDLFQSEWIRDNRNVFQKDPAELSYFRQLWIRFFECAGHAVLRRRRPDRRALRGQPTAPDQPTAPLRRAPATFPTASTCRGSPPLRERRPAGDPPPVLCLIGRVVPIKDIKTFIRAMRIVATRLPAAEGWIAGPEDEDPRLRRGMPQPGRRASV